MGKKAIFCYGTPVENENKERFEKNCQTNLSIMSEIAEALGYEYEIVPFKKLDFNFNEKSLVYFTGHGNNFLISDYQNNLDDFFEAVSKEKSKKVIILDACTREYIQTKDFPKHIKVIGGNEIYDSASLAKLLYDAILCRKKKLKDITKKTFEEMKYHWVKVKN